MKYIGIILFMGAVMFFSDEYRKRAWRELSEAEDFLSFISHIRLQMGCFLAEPKDFFQNFSSENFDRIDFGSLVASGMSLSEAFSAVSEQLSLREEDKDTLGELFSRLGDGYLDDGIKLLDSTYQRFEKRCESIRAETKKNSRIVAVTSASISVGVLLLIL